MASLQPSHLGKLLPALVGMLGVLAAASWAPDGAFAKEPKPELVKYKKDSGVGLGAFGGKLVYSYGYKDRMLEDGNWEVTGQASSSNPQHSQYIAIYRATEIAAAEGKTYIEVVTVNGKGLRAYNAPPLPATTSYGTRYVMEFRLSDTPDEANNCATDVLRPTCMTIEVAGAIHEIRPHLKF